MFKRRALPDFLQVPWGPFAVLIAIGAWWVSQGVIGALLVVLSQNIAPIADFLKAAQAGNLDASFGLDLISVTTGLAIVGLYLRKYDLGWSAVGWRRVGILKTVAYVLVAVIGFVFIADALLVALQALVPGFDANQPQTNDFTGAVHTHQGLALLALVIVPPIFEETIFRGFVFPALAKRTGLVWGAIFSSALFGLAHGQANLFVYTMILGLVLCFIYVRTKSIVPGIILHMLNNFLAFIVLAGSGK